MREMLLGWSRGHKGEIFLFRRDRGNFWSSVRYLARRNLFRIKEHRCLRGGVVRLRTKIFLWHEIAVGRKGVRLPPRLLTCLRELTELGY